MSCEWELFCKHSVQHQHDARLQTLTTTHTWLWEAVLLICLVWRVQDAIHPFTRCAFEKGLLMLKSDKVSNWPTVATVFHIPWPRHLSHFVGRQHVKWKPPVVTQQLFKGLLSWASPQRHSAALTVVCQPAVCLVPSASVLKIMLLVVSQRQCELCKQPQWHLDSLMLTD